MNILIFLLIAIKSVEFESFKINHVVDLINFETNECMRNIINDLKLKCRDIGDLNKRFLKINFRQLALKFTNCFLKNSGKP